MILKKEEIFKGEDKAEHTFTVRNPSTNELIGEVPDLGVEEIRKAIEKAHKAFFS